MHQEEMNLWLLTWEVWGKVKFGSTGIASDDIGVYAPKEIAADAVTPARFGPSSANSDVDTQLNNGTTFRGLG